MSKKVKFQRKNGKGIVEQETEITQDDSRVAMIQMLIPLGLQAIEDLLQEEIIALAGDRYSREENNSNQRWGSNPGSVFLGDQKVSVNVPRVRDMKTKKEIPLKSYHALQSPKHIDDLVMKRVMNGLSTRKYRQAAVSVPETFGINKSSISNKFIKSSARKLKDFLERDLSGEDIVAIFMDGKSMAEMDMIIAMGITTEGKKIILGFIESGSENHKICEEFIQNLVDRGLDIKNEILFVVDGSKGLRKGIKNSLKEKAVIQRCQWHKRENVVSYLPKAEQINFRNKLQRAYEKTTYKKAKAELLKIEKELKLLNESAVKSLQEGLEETLTLHRLGLFTELGRSFKTTNCLESVNRQIGIYTDRVSYWKNSNQRQRWLAMALTEIEPRLRTAMGHKHLTRLREKMRQDGDKAQAEAEIIAA